MIMYTGMQEPRWADLSEMANDPEGQAMALVCVAVK